MNKVCNNGYMFSHHLCQQQSQTTLPTQLTTNCGIGNIMAGRAPVLRYFEEPKSKSNGLFKAKCKLCPREVSMKGRSTSNLITHMQRHHPTVDISRPVPGSGNSANEPGQQSLASFVTTSSQPQKKWQSSDQGKQKELQDAVVTFVADNLVPLHVVETPSFRNLLGIAEPRFTMPSRKHLTRKLIPERHDRVHAELCQALCVTPSVCLTLDIWSNRQMRSYMGVTAHYITDFKLYSTMLACKRLFGAHTAENIVQYFEEIVTSFGINKKVNCVITDNARNMLKAMQLFQDLNEDEDESSDEEDDDPLEPVTTEDVCDLRKNYPCFAHTIQLVVKDGMQKADQVNRVLNKVAKLVSHVRHSTQASDLFEGEVRLQISNATRWNSQVTMLQSLLRVPQATMEKLDYGHKLKEYEMNVVNDVVEILSPFAWATDMTQGENIVTASTILPVIRGLHAEINKLATKFRSNMISALKSSLESRLGQFEENETFRLAAALDPRWKLAWCISLKEADDMKKVISQQISDMVPSSTEPEQSMTQPKKRSRFLTFMQDQERLVKNTSSSSTLSRQIDTYFQTECLPEEADPLAYWKEQQHVLPELAKLACQYLQVPASSAPVERLFSIAGKVFRPDRCNLSDRVFEQLMFIRSNKKI